MDVKRFPRLVAFQAEVRALAALLGYDNVMRLVEQSSNEYPVELLEPLNDAPWDPGVLAQLHGRSSRLPRLMPRDRNDEPI